jgi:hypothetical protein
MHVIVACMGFGCCDKLLVCMPYRSRQVDTAQGCVSVQGGSLGVKPLVGVSYQCTFRVSLCLRLVFGVELFADCLCACCQCDCTTRKRIMSACSHTNYRDRLR